MILKTSVSKVLFLMTLFPAYFNVLPLYLSQNLLLPTKGTPLQHSLLEY
jgi:hypothetical protein